MREQGKGRGWRRWTGTGRGRVEALRPPGKGIGARRKVRLQKPEQEELERRLREREGSTRRRWEIQPRGEGSSGGEEYEKVGAQRGSEHRPKSLERKHTEESRADGRGGE